MTVLEIEKKAEEYAKKKFDTIGNFLIPDDIAEIYIDGYEKGIKDNDNYHLPAIEQKNEIINQLEKENEELKAQIEKINELNVNLQNRFLRLMKFKIENEKLKSQIERIKTCKVCENKKCENSHSNVEYIWHKEGDFICDNRDKWELAE